VGTGFSSLISSVIDARLAALPSILSFATLLGRELGLPPQFEVVSRLGGEKGRLVPDICDSGREAVDGCRSRRVLIAGEGGSDMAIENVESV
jgi:hypothetical protein